MSELGLSALFRGRIRSLSSLREVAETCHVPPKLLHSAPSWNDLFPREDTKRILPPGSCLFPAEIVAVKFAELMRGC